MGNNSIFHQPMVKTMGYEENRHYDGAALAVLPNTALYGRIRIGFQHLPGATLRMKMAT
jgi:hypothetical protein